MTLMDNYFPMAEGPGANSGMDRWRTMGRRWHPTGVLLGVMGELTPTFTPGSNLLTIATGAAWIEGFYAERSSPTPIQFVTGPGIGVLRLDPAANDVRLVWRQGATIPEQSPLGVYEMPLCSISATNVMTDLRVVIGGSGGRVASARGPISQIDCAPGGTNLATMIFTAIGARRYEISAFARGFGANAVITSGFDLITDNGWGNVTMGQNVALGGNQWLVGGAAGLEYVQTTSTGQRVTFTIRGAGSGGANGTLRVPANVCFLLARDIGPA